MKKILFIAFIAFTIFSCSSDSSSSSSSLGQWKLMNFPSDLITANGNTLFSVSSNTILKRSTDNGDNWSTINTGLTNVDSYSMFSMSGTIYLAAFKNGISGVTPSTTKYYKSTDNGDTWVQTWVSLQNQGSGLPSKIFQLGSKLIGATNGTSPDVFCSNDNGITWDLSNNSFNSPLGYNFLYDGNNYYFVTAQSIYKSTDGVNYSTLNNAPSVLRSASAFVGNKIYLSDATNYGVKMSNDGGVVWNAVNQGLEFLDSNYQPISFMHTKNQSIYAGCEGGGVYKLSANSSTWLEIGTPDDDVYVSGTVYNIQTTDNYVFAVTSDGVYRPGI
jgi:hypothetical protein